MLDISFYKGKKVLVTGHTGFKGSWMCVALINAGAVVTGYSLGSQKEYSLFEMSGIANYINHITGDIRDLEHLKKVFERTQPEIVIHMAAQPIVRESYIDPVYTYETNVMGTVNILECVRLNHCVKSFLNVTTDKVYENKEWEWGYRENEPLDGYDPYSNSKSCSELVTHSYKRSFFSDYRTAISSARAGNVIGGGDFAKDRIIPDCVRAVMSQSDIVVRNPFSIRPYQHVLEPIMAYLLIAAKQYEDIKYEGYYNIGPDTCDCITTGELVELFCKSWGNGLAWKNEAEENAPHEANFLRLDCSKAKTIFDWNPKWHIDDAVKATIEWTKVWLDGGNVAEEMKRQILFYLGGK